MEYDQSNPNYKKPDYYSYNPEIEQSTQDTFNLDPIIEPPNYGTDIYGNPLTAKDIYSIKPLKKKPLTEKPSADQTTPPSDANNEYSHLVLGKPFELGYKYGDLASEPAPSPPEQHPDKAHPDSSTHNEPANKFPSSRDYNVGKQIYLGTRAHNPSTPEGKKLNAPEVRHLNPPNKTTRPKVSRDEYRSKIAVQTERQAALEREKQRQAAIRKEQERKTILKRSRELKLYAQRTREKAPLQQPIAPTQAHPPQPTATQPAKLSGSGLELDPSFSSFDDLPTKNSGSFRDIVPQTGFNAPQQMHSVQSYLDQLSNRFFDNAEAFAYNRTSTPRWGENPEPWGWVNRDVQPIPAQNKRNEPEPAQAQPDPQIALAPVITFGAGVPDIQIAQNSATFDPGAKSSDAGTKAIAAKAFNKFLRQQLKKRAPALAEKLVGSAVLDEIGIGEIFSVGFTVQMVYEIYQEWNQLQHPQTAPTTTPSPTNPPSQAIPAGSPSSTAKQTPIDLGNVPQMGTSTDSVDAFLKAQDAQIHQSDRQMAAKQQREVQLAVSAEHRQQQRNAIDSTMRDKLYKVDAQANLERYQTWLLQHDPKFLDQMNRQAGARYDTLTNQGKDLEFEGNDSRQSFRKNLLSHTMHQSDIRAREVIEYSAMELNLNQVTNRGTGFNPKKLAQIRSNFDTVVAGGYAKQLEPKVVKYIETQANAAYLKETGNKEVDRNSQLWKTLRNVELLKYDRSLWETVQEAPMGMMTNPNDPSLGSNVLNRPTQGSTLNVPTHTGHPTGMGQEKQQPVGGGFDGTVNPELTRQQEGFPTNQPVDGMTHVFESHDSNFREEFSAHPSTPTGSKGRPLKVPAPANQAEAIGGRTFSGHALDRMQRQGIVPTAVENTIQQGQQSIGKNPGTTAYYDFVNNLTVITDNKTGDVITVDYGQIKQ